MRRLIIEEPFSRAALWCRRLAVFGLLLAGIAVVTSRGGLVDPSGALAVLATGLGFAVLALGAAVVAAAVIWRTGRPGIGAMLGGTFLALLLLAYPVWLRVAGRDRPDLQDVSTNLVDPPRFSDSAKALAARRGVGHEVPTDALRQLQKTVYPDLASLNLELGADDAYRVTAKLILAHRWTLVDAHPPAGRPSVGQIDAVAKTALMGFPEDVTIRITGTGPTQSRVDIRSASRFSYRDSGAVAARVAALVAEIEDAADQD